MGNPFNIAGANAAAVHRLTENTFVTVQDYHSSPTKGFLVTHRNEQDFSNYYSVAFEKRQREEHYVMKDEPDQVHNVDAYRSIKPYLNPPDDRTQKTQGWWATFDNPPYKNFACGSTVTL